MRREDTTSIVIRNTQTGEYYTNNTHTTFLCLAQEFDSVEAGIKEIHRVSADINNCEFLTIYKRTVLGLRPENATKAIALFKEKQRIANEQANEKTKKSIATTRSNSSFDRSYSDEYTNKTEKYEADIDKYLELADEAHERNDYDTYKKAMHKAKYLEKYVNATRHKKTSF